LYYICHVPSNGKIYALFAASFVRIFVSGGKTGGCSETELVAIAVSLHCVGEVDKC
jgi:hypothetical protein